MKRKSKPYLLFIFAEFKEGSTILQDLPMQLMPVSSSKYFKYNHTKSNLICNFESEFDFADLREFIDGTISAIVNQWYLIEHPHNIATYMDDELKLNLFDLNSENIQPDKLSRKQGSEEMYMIMDYFLSQSLKQMNQDEMDELFFKNDDEDPLISKLKIKKDNIFSKPTLDSLLEKIKEKGIEKLTKYEKQILDEYARN